MTIKEINNLRKSGCLQEALTAAENEFAQNPNKYTAGTLFWCLYDLSKQQYGNDASDIFEQMISLYNDFCNGDEYMQKTIVAIKQRKLTHYQMLLKMQKKVQILLIFIDKLQYGIMKVLLILNYTKISVGLYIIH